MPIITHQGHDFDINEVAPALIARVIAMPNDPRYKTLYLMLLEMLSEELVDMSPQQIALLMQ